MGVGCVYESRTASRAGTYNGPPVDVGQGQAWTFVTLDETGEATNLGVRFSETALSGLPEHAEHGEAEYLLSLPPEASVSGYDHVTLDWNPQGHIPPGVYDLPHFDFHFFVIDDAKRNAITATGDDLARARKAPEPSYMPVDYVLPEGTEVPRMGAHAIDPSSDEFQGKTFTQTFIYGFYDGGIIFMEPMMSLAFLQAYPQVSMPVKQPPEYAGHFGYPAFYGIYYDADLAEYSVVLEQLMKH
ncbi:MAG: hypothetical protein GYB21_14800 [Oceanospirillales bacterium]|nr:hypothetical protein [Oceanospirillales bacterium]